MFGLVRHKLKQPPNRPFSGRVMLRLPPELHASAAAEVTGMSFNQWAAKALAQAAEAS
jgi:predicted HicB family RNase H-like nuclease